MEEDISLQDVISSAFSYQMNGVYTAIPCVVLNVHDDLRDAKVDVQPLVNKKYKNGTEEELPPILAVPLIFPSSSTSAFTFPVNVGDTVLCVFSHRGIDNFKQGSGQPTVPTDYRKFDKRDAIAVPGLMPFNKSVNNPARRSLPHDTKDAVFVHNINTGNESEVRLKASGNIEVTTRQDVAINCRNATVNSTSTTVNSQSAVITTPSTEWTGNITFTGDIVFNGNTTQNGIFTLDGINMNTHRHSGVEPGAGTSSVPVA